jgi:hypothetical protein
LCLLVASVKRYFILLPEGFRKKAEHLVICFASILFFICFNKTSSIIAYASDLENVTFTPWIFILAVIPLIDAYSIWNSLLYLYTASYLINSLMVVLWASWSITQLLGVSTGGSNSLFLALGCELESSVGVITMSLSKLGSPSMQRHKRLLG